MLHSLIIIIFYDALKSSHITFILFYYDKVEKVTVENVGTYVVGFWGGGELLVPSDHDETGGVAKVDVSNIMNQSLSFFFAYQHTTYSYKFTSHVQLRCFSSVTFIFRLMN